MGIETKRDFLLQFCSSRRWKKTELRWDDDDHHLGKWIANENETRMSNKEIWTLMTIRWHFQKKFPYCLEIDSILISSAALRCRRFDFICNLIIHSNVITISMVARNCKSLSDSNSPWRTPQCLDRTNEKKFNESHNFNFMQQFFFSTVRWFVISLSWENRVDLWWKHFTRCCKNLAMLIIWLNSLDFDGPKIAS